MCPVPWPLVEGTCAEVERFRRTRSAIVKRRRLCGVGTETSVDPFAPRRACQRSIPPSERPASLGVADDARGLKSAWHGLLKCTGYADPILNSGRSAGITATTRFCVTASRTDTHRTIVATMT